MSGASQRSRSATPRRSTSFVVPVAGMTCRTCERRIERHVGRLPNVERVSASAPKGRVEIVATGKVPEADLRAAIVAAGYDIGHNRWVTTDVRVWVTAIAGILVVAGLALAAQLTGILGIEAGAGDIAEGGLLVALLIGVAAGVSTCLALTGGLVLALSAAFAARSDPDTEAGLVARLRPSAVFVLGRIVGFALLGALLGGIGASVAMPPTLVAALMIAAAVLMTLLGVRLSGISPRLAAWSPTLPPGLARRLGLDPDSVAGYSDARAAALGAATFFLPCGFTQAVQVYALSTGSPVTAGAIMAMFAIGTAPGLLALAGLPSLIPAEARPTFTRVIGVVVLGFALVNAAAGLRLAGLEPAIGGGDVAAGAPVVEMDGDVQVVRTFQVAEGYLPQTASLYAGLPTRWIVESLEPRSCAIFLVVPSLGVQVMLEPGENAIDLPPLPPGRVAYSCSMGMYGGWLNVVEPQTGTLAPARS